MYVFARLFSTVTITNKNVLCQDMSKSGFLFRPGRRIYVPTDPWKPESSLFKKINSISFSLCVIKNCQRSINSKTVSVTRSNQWIRVNSQSKSTDQGQPSDVVLLMSAPWHNRATLYFVSGLSRSPLEGCLVFLFALIFFFFLFL